MITVGAENYIPVGCLVVEEAESNIPHELWSLPDLNHWKHLGPTTLVDHRVVEGESEPYQTTARLSSDIQQLLLGAKPIVPYRELLQKQWIRFAFCVSLDDGGRGIIRVYLLPDDVERRLVDRSDPTLCKARTRLMSRLDFSSSTWHGEAGIAERLSSPVPFSLAGAETPVDDEQQSLLAMFNNIPSPSPQPNIVQDMDARDAMYGLIDSDIPGLKTALYPYQRESAALMLQKEAQPEQVIDPRFVKVVDQCGKTWYYDWVNCVGLREPRHYDAARGGILAEEMGSGKTLICLALILATKHMPTKTPDIYQGSTPKRSRVASLADMAAACITNNGVPWKRWFDTFHEEGVEYSRCIEAIRRNPAWYSLPPPPQRFRITRRLARESPPDESETDFLGNQIPNSSSQSKIYNSHISLVIVPANLVQQWKQEIAKHTSGLRVLILVRKQTLPPLEELLEFDVILFSSTRFERLREDAGCVEVNGVFILDSPLMQIHFKRCIVDEGHRLGNSTTGSKSNLLLMVDSLHLTSRWIITGTPSKGLYGVDDSSPASRGLPTNELERPNSRNRLSESSDDLEKDDLKRIGAIAQLYLKARPWANTACESGDSPADWLTYVMQARHSRRSNAQKHCLKATLESLIIRHRLSEIGDLLPVVDERVVYLEGSYQDKLSLNIFSMMIIFNSVLSERTDQDYFFHHRQGKNLIQLVSNLRQASFFGGSFFSPAEIRKAVETAEQFLKEGKIQISQEDEAMLHEAISFGRVAVENSIKTCANTFHEIPIYVQNFPGGLGRAWSLDDREGDPVCTDFRMVLILQQFLSSSLDAPTSLRMLFQSGRFEARGQQERDTALEAQQQADRPTTPADRTKSKTLAGNTQLGEDRHSNPVAARSLDATFTAQTTEVDIAEPLARTQIVSTASAKLSYLIDQIVRYQQVEQILIFYENENVAYYLSGMLDVLQVHHLIYAKTLTTERRAQYVATFNQNPKFRVLLMDISQAAFGLDMRSASRIYFINPVLNPQVEAQAIGRVRRISQKKPVTVETLVLRDSLEEVIIKRRGEMTQAEQRKCRSILDDRPIHNWIRNARIIPLAQASPSTTAADSSASAYGDVISGPSQMAKLAVPQLVFGRGFGRRVADPDEDLVMADVAEGTSSHDVRSPSTGAVDITTACEGGAPIALNKRKSGDLLQRRLPMFREASPVGGLSRSSLQPEYCSKSATPGLSVDGTPAGKGEAGSDGESERPAKRKIRFVAFAGVHDE